MSMTTLEPRVDSARHSVIHVRRWPSERPLFAICVAVSAVLWLLLTLSVVGLVYALSIALFFFVVHLSFIVHVRGNSVRIGADQFPALHQRIGDIARKIGMKKAPAAYLMQGGGALNAFATRFARSHMIVLLSDLLEACGDNTAARDMIIGHELGHIHAGHLRWRWITLPASIVPFLGAALSRAREYTCDRIGLVAAENQEGALLGLTILAVGGKHAPSVHRPSFVAQRSDLNTGWMRIGEWLSTHPPLARRIVALDPQFGTVRDSSGAGTIRALSILGTVVAVVAVITMLGVSKLPSLLKRFEEAAQVAQQAEPAADDETYTAPEFDVAVIEWNATVERLSQFLASEVGQGRPIPATGRQLATRWQEAHPAEEMPIDPFDGSYSGYARTPGGYLLWSSGPDQEANTHDDIVRHFDLATSP